MRLLSDPPPNTTPPTTTTTPFANTSDGCVMIGAGLPPVPAKLVSKIEAGDYVDMTELLPDRLGICKSTSTDDSFKRSRQKRRLYLVFWKWVQCYGIYMAVVCQKEPHRIQDLLGYQTLIIEASLEYQGDSWIGYDQRFRQRAATNTTLVWAKTDSPLWNLAFAGQANASRCRHCFSLSHSSVQCDWSPDPPPLMDVTTTFPR